MASIILSLVSLCGLDSLNILLSSRQSIQTVFTFVWPCEEPQSTYSASPCWGTSYFLLWCRTTPCCSSSPYSKGSLKKKKKFLIQYQKAQVQTYFLLLTLNKVPDLSESQASHLPTGFMFPYRDNASKIIFQYISHMIAEFEKRKLSKLRTDISGALFQICAFLQRSWVLAWFMCSCFIIKSCLTLCNPMDCSLPGSSIYEISQARILEWGFHFLLQGNLPNTGIKPKSPALAGEFFNAELPGKPSLIHTMYILGQVVLLQRESKFWRKIQLETPFDHISKPHTLVSINFKN